MLRRDSRIYKYVTRPLHTTDTARNVEVALTRHNPQHFNDGRDMFPDGADTHRTLEIRNPRDVESNTSKIPEPTALHYAIQLLQLRHAGGYDVLHSSINPYECLNDTKMLGSRIFRAFSREVVMDPRGIGLAARFFP